MDYLRGRNTWWDDLELYGDKRKVEAALHTRHWMLGWIMNPRHFYAYERFTSALRSLAIGSGDVRVRLSGAYMDFHPVKENHLPEDLHSDYEWVIAQLTRFGPVLNGQGEVVRGAVAETLRRIRRSTGVKIAERILHIYTELNWLYIKEREEP